MANMDIDLIEEQNNDEPEVHEVIIPELPEDVTAPVANNVPSKNPAVDEAIERERLKRKLEVAAWAESKRLIVNAPPTPKQLNRVMSKLKKGQPLLKALKKVCSYSTWCKWREEYPELMDMENDAREYRIQTLLEEQKLLADQEGREKMGQIARDKLRMDIRQAEIDRLDRLTESRNEKFKKPGNLVPIQINVGYGK